MKTISLKTLYQWQQWLAKHHDSESEVWLVFHKIHTGVASISYKDALDEALCFGWVDSLVKRLDDDCYAYIKNELKKHPAALQHFETLSLSHRRRYLGWIESAKRDETKARRLEEAIRLLSAGKQLGLK